MNLYEMIKDDLPKERSLEYYGVGNELRTTISIGHNKCLSKIIELLKRCELDEKKIEECCIGWYGGDWEEISKALCNKNIITVKE